MSKIQIKGSVYSDENLECDVCSHLKPILDFLEAEGASWDKSKPLYTDKGGAHTLKIQFHINFSKIESHFDIPDFVELSKEYNSVICRRCWCDIEGA